MLRHTHFKSLLFSPSPLPSSGSRRLSPPAIAAHRTISACGNNNGSQLRRRELLLLIPSLAAATAFLSSSALADDSPPPPPPPPPTPTPPPPPPPPPPPAAEEVLSRVYDAAVIGEPQAVGKEKRKRVWEKLMGARVVYLGEAELVPDKDDRYLELEIVKSLRARCVDAERPVSVAIEAFPCNLQEQLNQFMDGG